MNCRVENGHGVVVEKREKYYCNTSYGNCFIRFSSATIRVPNLPISRMVLNGFDICPIWIVKVF